MKQVNLSELGDSVELFALDAAYKMTVSELKSEPYLNPHNYEWFIAEPASWVPNAEWMIEQYIECEYSDGLYEDWDERITDCFTEDDYNKIQSILEEVVSRDKAVTDFWQGDTKVILDCL